MLLPLVTFSTCHAEQNLQKSNSYKKIFVLLSLDVWIRVGYLILLDEVGMCYSFSRVGVCVYCTLFLFFIQKFYFEHCMILSLKVLKIM